MFTFPERLFNLKATWSDISSLLQSLSVPVASVTLRDSSCQAQSNGSHFLLVFPVISCGTEGLLLRQPRRVQYKNMVRWETWKDTENDHMVNSLLCYYSTSKRILIILFLFHDRTVGDFKSPCYNCSISLLRKPTEWRRETVCSRVVNSKTQST